jgi:cytochrome c oxidase subunit II
MLERTHRWRHAGTTAAGVVAAAAVLASCGNSTGPKNDQNALRPSGPYAQKILDLTKPFFWIAVVVGLAVIVATFYVALRFREKPGETRMPTQTHGNTRLEVAWTIIPALILAVMAVPTIATVFDLAKRPVAANTVHVTVTARQWWWQFTYTDPGNGVETANELHIPVGADVALILQGPPPGSCPGPSCYQNGVIHSFWVPALNGKKDVVPGRHQSLKLKASKPGTYLGQCAEYCGLSHADMRLRVIAQPPAEYQAWVRSQLQPLPANVLASPSSAPDAPSFDKYNTAWTCLACHSDQPTTPGAVGPNLTHLADRTKFAAEKYALTYENLRRWVFNAPSMKPMQENPKDPLHPKVGMPNFSDVGMSQQQADEIARFLLCNTATDPNTTAMFSSQLQAAGQPGC